VGAKPTNDPDRDILGAVSFASIDRREARGGVCRTAVVAMPSREE
jgi:hypothetical protein